MLFGCLGLKPVDQCTTPPLCLLLLGLLPKAGALATVIPDPVLGGAMIVMFGIVGVQGIQILHKVDFTDNGNILVASVSVGLGLGVTMYPHIFQFLPTEFQIMMGKRCGCR